MTRPPFSGRAKRLAVFFAALVVFVVIAVLIASRLLIPWAEATLRDEAFARGVTLEPELTAVGLTGGILARARAEAPGLVAESGEVRVSWAFPEVLQGAARRIEVDAISATVDLARWLPAPSVAPAVTPAAGPGSAVPPLTGTIEPTPLPPSTGTQAPPRPLPPAAERPQREAPAEPKGSVPLWWREWPFAHFILGTSALNLRYGDASLPLTTGLELKASSDEHRLDAHLYGGGFQAHTVVLAAPDSRHWSMTGQWQGAHPLNLAKDLFPSHHPLQPDVWLKPRLGDWRVSTLNVEVLAEGIDEEVSRFSALIDHGPVRVERAADEGLVLRAASAGLTYEDGHWEKLEAVLEIDEARFAGAVTEGFMVNLGWSAAAPGRVEIPELRLEHERGLRARLAARGFLQEDGAVELQFAFAEVAFQNYAIAPFRWFLNAHDQRITSRMSDLSSPLVKDWQLARTEWAVENVSLRSPAPAPWRATGSTFLEYRPEMRSFAKVDWEAAPRDAEVIDVFAQIEGEIGEPLGKFAGAVARGGGFTLRGEGDWALADTVPYLFPFFPDLKGLLGKGRVRWQANAQSDPLLAFRATLGVTFEKGGFDFPKHKLEAVGLNGTVGLSARGPFGASQGEQVLTLDEVRLGEERMTDLKLRFRLVHRKELQILSFEAKWLGGRVSIEPFSFDPADPKFAATVRLVDIESKRLFPNPETMGFLIDAQLSGSIPLTYSAAGGLVLFDGILEALNPAKAVLEVRDKDVFGRFLPLPETFMLKQKVMAAVEKDFRFRSLRIDLFDSAQPLVPLTIEFEGGVTTPEVEMKSVRVKVPQRFERPLKGWEALLVLLSGGTVGL